MSWRLGGRRDGAWQSFTVANKHGADKVAALLKAHGHNLTRQQVAAHVSPVKEAGETVEAACIRHVASLTLEGGTRREYLRSIRLHIGPESIGQLDLNQVTREHVRLWVRSLSAKGQAPKSVSNHHALLSATLEEAVHDQKISANPCKGLRLPRKDDQTELDDEMCFLTPSEVQLIADALNDGYRHIPWILARTGLRWSEMTALKVSDVSLTPAPARLKVSRAWKRQETSGWAVGPPKTPRSRRTITLDAATVALLEPLLNRPGGAWLVTARDGRSPLPHSTFDRQWRTALYGPERRRSTKGQLRDGGLVGAGLIDKRPGIHDLRHTHASWLLEDPNVSMFKVSRRLGHEAQSTTERVYAHLRQDDDEAILGALDRI